MVTTRFLVMLLWMLPRAFKKLVQKYKKQLHETRWPILNCGGENWGCCSWTSSKYLLNSWSETYLGLIRLPLILHVHFILHCVSLHCKSLPRLLPTWSASPLFCHQNFLHGHTNSVHLLWCNPRISFIFTLALKGTDMHSMVHAVQDQTIVKSISTWSMELKPLFYPNLLQRGPKIRSYITKISDMYLNMGCSWKWEFLNIHFHIYVHMLNQRMKITIGWI